MAFFESKGLLDAFRDLEDKLAAEFEGQLEWQKSLLEKFVTDDDWSFVIKAHALIEASVTQLVVDSIGDQRFKKMIERLPLTDEQFGRISIAKELGLLEKDERRFILSFSTLRNQLAHRIDNVGFTFVGHFKILDDTKKKQWLKDFGWKIGETIFNENFLKENPNLPRELMAMYVQILVIHCFSRAVHLRAKSQEKDARLQGYEVLVERMQSTIENFAIIIADQQDARVADFHESEAKKNSGEIGIPPTI